MPEGAKNVLKARVDSHSDVADTSAARARQMEMAERQLGDLLVQKLRAAKGPVALSEFQEEWHDTDHGAQVELSVEVEAQAEEEA